jgi:hypothetical protein
VDSWGWKVLRLGQEEKEETRRRRKIKKKRKERKNLKIFPSEVLSLAPRLPLTPDGLWFKPVVMMITVLGSCGCPMRCGDPIQGDSGLPQPQPVCQLPGDSHHWGK